MSIKDLRLVTDAYVERIKIDVKNRQAMDYELAVMIAGFVGASLSGKKIPSYDELFSEPNVDNDIIRIREQFKDFAAMANKKREAK